MTSSCNFCENPIQDAVQPVQIVSDLDVPILEIAAKHFWFTFYCQVQKLYPNDVTTKHIEIEPLSIKKEVIHSEDTDYSDNDDVPPAKPLVTDDDIRFFCPMECPVCSKKFKKFDILRTHCRQVHEQRCPYVSCCGARYETLKKLQEHILFHINPAAFRCELCNKNLKTMQNLIQHRKVVHVPRDDNSFNCKLCPEKFTARYMLYDHMKYQHTGDKNIECGHCSRRFFDMRKLSDHMRYKHQKGNEIICDICSKVFTSKSNFERHQLSFHNDARVNCPLCKKSLKNEYSLQAHMERHREATMDIKCEFCDKRSPTVNAMRQHVRAVHTNQERNYKCTYCDKAFLRKNNLKTHITIHTGELLYGCESCEKRCRTAGNLYAHRKKYHPEEFEKQRLEKLTSLDE
ncbi:AAEL009502-PA [Aedes aegypti]|uniref:AAEL009502-PA n=1 Tax=Aedes aegypti TaxID=7159 RepID=Q0IEM5_AEDAE|nr:AAEL009502-PA [Aedes aegypti]